MRRADNLTTVMCQLSWNLGFSASWNPQGLSRPIMGLLYLYLYYLHNIGKWKVATLRTIKLYKGFGGTAPFILNLGVIWMWLPLFCGTAVYIHYEIMYIFHLQYWHFSKMADTVIARRLCAFQKVAVGTLVMQQAKQFNLKCERVKRHPTRRKLFSAANWTSV
jgi:hypothetical protein